MAYNVFSGTLNPTQSIKPPHPERMLRMLLTVVELVGLCIHRGVSLEQQPRVDDGVVWEGHNELHELGRLGSAVSSEVRGGASEEVGFCFCFFRGELQKSPVFVHSTLLTCHSDSQLE